jgi:hypothetical protein
VNVQKLDLLYYKQTQPDLYVPPNLARSRSFGRFTETQTRQCESVISAVIRCLARDDASKLLALGAEVVIAVGGGLIGNRMENAP